MSDYEQSYLGQLRRYIVSFVFRVDKWSGTLSSTTDETVAAHFFQLDSLPETSPMYHETITDLQQFDGQVILK